MCHEESRFSFLQRISHLLHVIRWGGSGNFPANAEDGVHGDGVPDGVLGEESDGFRFFKAIVANESGGEVGCGLLDFAPVQRLLRYRIVITTQFFFGVAVEG